MPHQLRVHQGAAYLHVHVTGTNDPDAVRGYLREILEICANQRSTAVLIEENLAGPGLKLVDIYSIVSENSEYPRAHLLKVAFVNVNSEHAAGSAKFAETVARNRGINVRAFPIVEEARAWLREA